MFVKTREFSVNVCDLNKKIANIKMRVSFLNFFGLVRIAGHVNVTLLPQPFVPKLVLRPWYLGRVRRQFETRLERYGSKG